MKFIDADRQISTDASKARRAKRTVITKGGMPIALVVGIDALDEEQLELGSNDALWKLVEARRQQKTLTREHLERDLH